MVALFDLKVEQLDVKIAFLHGELEEQIYMHQPEGFIISGKENHVCLLKKSLYGLKQSPRQWYKRFVTFMIGNESNDYHRSEYDNCVYHKKLFDGSFIYLLLYVDDMLIAYKNMFEINMSKTQLQREFEMKDLGTAKKILGMEIHRDQKVGKLYLSQKNYIEKVLERFGMQGLKPLGALCMSWFALRLDISHAVSAELTVVYSDSQSAIHSTKNQMVYERAKHIDVFIRDVIAQGAIVLKKIPMVDNLIKYDD
uniref:Reverse transcriptase Ty1/copia-type domain-containing protein n=1 Tax=Vitis vinifera TaxID=29760 RepID=A5BQ14_VITVI|nr:hypothetical protein VITISV_003396 [Vitis vinifera]